jgi:hypothetical protein
MRISEFTHIFPEYAFDFSASIREQLRVYDAMHLAQLPLELEADAAYHSGGRGRPNTNQTLSHSQCATCLRVLRNDFFYTVPSMMKRNMVYSHCRECNQTINAVRYDAKAELIQARRIVIWQYLAPSCSICGFAQHMSAMDLHHLGHKEAHISELLTYVTFTPVVGKIEVLLREASNCVPLCSNCHRMLHARVIKLPATLTPLPYNLAELLIALKSL